MLFSNRLDRKKERRDETKGLSLHKTVDCDIVNGEGEIQGEKGWMEKMRSSVFDILSLR